MNKFVPPALQPPKRMRVRLVRSDDPAVVIHDVSVVYSMFGNSPEPLWSRHHRPNLMPSRSCSLVDRLFHTGMALLTATLGIYVGVHKRTLGRTGRGVELGEWSWFVGGGLVAVAVLGLVLTWWPEKKPPV